MQDTAAWKVALEVFHVPSRVRILQAKPVPNDILTILRIATGDQAVVKEVVELSGRTGEVISRAAAFYIEQVLLCPDADSYRVLGAKENATPGELRRNMALLMRWLHPDMRNGSSTHKFLVGRITQAWEDLKQPDRRAAYDSALRIKRRRPNTLRRRRPRIKSRRLAVPPKPMGKVLRRLLAGLLGRFIR